jgi:DNA replication protein DnaC
MMLPRKGKMLSEIHAVCDALKLRHTRAAIAEALQEAQKKKPSYSGFLLNLLRSELGDKRNRQIAGRIKNSGLDEYWSLETFPWHLQPCLAKYRKEILELSELDFLDKGKSIVFIGKPAVGKSGLASGILMKALYGGRTGRAVKAHNLFEQLGASLADRSTKRLLGELCRLDLLVIEEFGFVNPLDQVQINNFFRLMDSRANKKSCVVNTNLGFQEWPKFLGNGPVTAALLSRLLQKCHVITFALDAVNLREPKFKLPARAEPPPILQAYFPKPTR